MTRYVALLRAVNVGGTGRLPMAELVQLCEEVGFSEIRTYIQSGNAVFSSRVGPGETKAALERRLQEHLGNPVSVALRDASEMSAVVAANPFSVRQPTFTHVIFLDTPPAHDALDAVTGHAGEEMKLGRREIYVYYPLGQGRSKLRIPGAAVGTARNMNTVAKLAAMAAPD
ncbi:DUF1697 domain-containing protein [Tropicimonas isoalkanivorans]|uniref:Uncharacterized conserved protein, DUF1697 family n=1 Tax=Tropicimonas isoalkanivorans TaxID=441112 RepID=A0A1I1JHY9_9RHOB|nr:DUF1697 domain-containing protein [Tropicimonas isoalkanivorans]SFC48076.1 Uncharacterized conserved protein, DUF1697 family [Tropicimonas isoalkanivorans]